MRGYKPSFPLVIAVSGKAFSGKDTFYELAQSLTEELYQEYNLPVRITRFAFGDAVKEAATYLGWDGEKDERGRDGLIWVGNGAREHFNPSIWIDKVLEKMDAVDSFSGVNIFIVTDCRYPDEVDSLRDYAGEFNFSSVRIIGKNNPVAEIMTEEQLNSASETALDSYNKFEFDFINDHASGKEPYRNFVKLLIRDALLWQRKCQK